MGEAAMADSAREQIDALRKQFAHLYQQGDYRAALQPAEQSYHLSLRVLGPDHPDVVASMVSLAKLYGVIGQQQEAWSSITS